jgi:hypothetical protein
MLRTRFINPRLQYMLSRKKISFLEPTLETRLYLHIEDAFCFCITKLGFYFLQFWHSGY